MSGDNKTFDVSIICALGEEARAFIEETERQCSVTFQQAYNPLTHEYYHTTIYNQKGEALSLLVSWQPRYGPVEASLHIKPILNEFKPRFAAMTGICAGDKTKVKLGDIIVAERAFFYDTGKIVVGKKGRKEHLRDTNTQEPHEDVLHYLHMFDAWESAVETIPRPYSKHQQRDWLLSKLLDEATSHIEDIDKHEREHYAPDWLKIVQELQKGPNPFLTEDRRLVDKSRVLNLQFEEGGFPFKDLAQPKLRIAPIASGSTVRSDNPFDEIRLPVRDTVAIDMEGATFYRTVAQFPGLRSLLVKGICDYADSDKDDSYHTYASQVSATYVLSFIKEYVTLERIPLQSRARIYQMNRQEEIAQANPPHVKMTSQDQGQQAPVSGIPTTPSFSPSIEDASSGKDKFIFISYADSDSDRQWAEWIFNMLKGAGYIAKLSRAFVGAEDFIQEWQKGTTRAEHTIVVISPIYLQTLEQQPGWGPAFAQAFEGKKRTVMPVRIEKCKLPGLFSTIVPIDLFDVDEDTAREKLLNGINPSARLSRSAIFPGSASTPSSSFSRTSSANSPLFPGESVRNKDEESSPTSQGMPIFFAYAREDEKMLKKLIAHFKLMELQGLIRFSYQWEMSGGDRRDLELERRLDEAQIILLLISSDFMNSPECYSIAKRAMERREEPNTVRVIPVILHPTDLEDAPFKNLAFLPSNDKSVEEWTSQDQAFLDIAKGIRKVVKHFE